MKLTIHSILMWSPLGHLYRYIPFARRIYWNLRVNDIIKNCRTGTQAEIDYPVYRPYLEKIKPTRVLDIGCGSGRLFPLYAELMIPEVIGIDFSSVAISKVKPYPNCSARVMEAENLNFPSNYFDAAISNAVLRHIPPGPPIARAISNIAEQCKSVLLKEPVRGRQFSYDFRHDYETLFAGKMHLIERYEYETTDVLIFAKQDTSAAHHSPI